MSRSRRASQGRPLEKKGSSRLFWALAAFLLVAGLALVLVFPREPESSAPTAAPDIPRLSVQEVKLKLDRGDDFVLAGVDPQEHFDAAHIPGARSIPLDDLPARYNELPSTRDIILYCM